MALQPLDPTRIKTAEFWKVQGDPLARALRKRFKRDGQYPKRKFQCVYSDELLENKGHNATCGTEQCMCPKAKVGPGDPTLLNHEKTLRIPSESIRNLRYSLFFL